MGEAAAVRSQHACCVRLVDDEHAVVAPGNGDEVRERRAVAVHGIEAFDSDPGATRAAFGPPAPNGVVETLGVVVCGRDRSGLAGAHAVDDTGVDQRVVHDEVVSRGQRREERVVGEEAAAEVKAALRAEERLCLGLQGLVLGIVAAQKPRAAGAHGNAAVERAGDGFGQLARGGEAEIVVGREIDAAAGAQGPQASPPLERLQRPLVAV